ncbi:MAG TPA: FAD-dependent oxidoreductase [Thermomicrobiales bacterium]|nr:FAD-dependent oxidoreductase [Thermomicrobiales bacterium]
MARLGRSVILTEESDWIGGQLTAQAVPLDEHPWIERTGCTSSVLADFQHLPTDTLGIELAWPEDIRVVPR